MVFILIVKWIIRRYAKKRLEKKAHDGWYNNNGGADQDPEMLKSVPSNDNRHPAKLFFERFLRFFQFVLGLTVAGLYGVDLNHAREKGVYADSRWVYAEVCTGLATATALFYLIAPDLMKKGPALAARTRFHVPLFAWETFLCLLWLILFGIFGKMYIGQNPNGDSGIVRMKHAVWVDLVNLLMWTCTATWSGLRWWKGKSAVDADGSNEPVPSLDDAEKYPQYPQPPYQPNVI